MPSRFDKDPQAVLDYMIDWTDWLDGDTISASSWTLSGAGLTQTSNSFTDTTATVWLSAGTNFEIYKVTNHITTDGGRQNDRTLTITVKNQ